MCYVAFFNLVGASAADAKLGALFLGATEGNSLHVALYELGRRNHQHQYTVTMPEQQAIQMLQ